MKTKRKAMPKPRNPFVLHLLKRPSGVHEKSYKTHRRDAKASLKKSTDYSDKLDTVFLNSLYGQVPEWSMGTAF